MILLIVALLVVGLVVIACGTPATTTSPPKTAAPATSAPTAAATPAATAPAITPTASAAPKPTATAAPAGPQKYGGILKMITSPSPLYLGDPPLLTDNASNSGAIPCLEALIFSDNAGKMLPVLASNWSVAADNKSITFNLRKGVKFHDGTDFNAKAVKWNMDRYLAAKLTSSAQWSSIDVVDDYTIRLNLKAFQNTILNGLEGSAGMMISPTAFEKNGAEFSKLNPVGTGPFKFKSFARDVSMEYVKADGYWDAGKPYLNGLQFVYIADATTARLAFEAGVGDVMSASSESVAAEMIAKGYTAEKRPGALMNLIPDSSHSTSPFSNVKVRQAVSYAIDREAMAKSLGYGLWEVVNQPASAEHFGHIDDSPYKYDPAKAKQLLAEAGFAKGFKTAIITANTFSRDPVVAIQAQLAAVGITVDINTVEFVAWNNYVAKGWDNALLYATQGATDTNYAAFLDRYYGAKSIRYPVMVKPAGLTDLIDKALATPDYATEKALCQQAVKMIVDDCTAIPLYIPSANFVLKPYVHDTYFSNRGGSGFRWSPNTAWLSK